jgi:hypothetical protein
LPNSRRLAPVPRLNIRRSAARLDLAVTRENLPLYDAGARGLLPKYIVHIGPPKTGSKFLQSQLFHARAELLKRGICYPDVWWTHDDEIMHVSLMERLKRGDNSSLRAQFSAINKSGYRFVVLSCEGFDDLRERELELLRDAIGNNPIEIVHYCRRWSEMIPSVWRMRIMMGRFLTFPEHYASFFVDPTGMGELNYSLVWRRFENIFGRDSLRLVSYSNLRKARVDLFIHFCDTFLGLGDAPVVAPQLIQHNVSPTTEETEILRALNYLNYLKTARVSLLMRVKFYALRSRLNLDPIVALMVDDRAACEIRDDAEAWKASWTAMCTYADRLVSKEFGKDLFDLKPMNAPFAYVRSNYLLKPKAFEMMSELFRFLTETPVRDPQLRLA